MHCQGITQFYLHTLQFICKWNEPYLPLPSQPQLVLIYRPRMEGRLSRPWCKVAPGEIQTHNLLIANPALYHTATSTLALCQVSNQNSTANRHLFSRSSDVEVDQGPCCICTIVLVGWHIQLTEAVRLLAILKPAITQTHPYF